MYFTNFYLFQISKIKNDLFNFEDVICVDHNGLNMIDYIYQFIGSFQCNDTN
jgi:hypothetical protein